jgi:internalin A
VRQLRFILIGSVLSLLILGFGYWILTTLVSEPPFPDEGLQAAVREQIGIRGRYIPSNELEGLTELDASGRGIESLRGIDYLPNLQRLDLGNNRVGDLRPLAELSRLAALDLRNNYISDLEAVHLESLAVLPTFSELSLQNNRESSHPEEPNKVRHITDISLLAMLSSLEVLDLRNNHVEDISPLSELKALRVLDLRGNRLLDNALENLSSLQQLTHLNLRENDLRDIGPLASLGKLEYLNLHSNQRIESILPLTALSRLKVLILRGVPVGEEAGVLRELVKLQRLNVRETGLRDLTILADLMEQGALQNRPEEDIYAQLDIRENPVGDSAEYAVLKPYWPKIARRYPEELPE